MSRNLVCNECGGTMQRGFIVETAGIAPKPYDATYWLEGKPEKSFIDGLKMDGKQAYYINSYRCESCGFLKIYAGPDNSKNDK
jgi:uncharacterized protein DUF6487